MSRNRNRRRTRVATPCLTRDGPLATARNGGPRVDSENVSTAERGMRPHGDLSARSSTTNSRSAVVGKCEVLAFYVGGAVDEYKLLHWVNAEACPLIRRLSEPCAGFYWVPEPVCLGIRPRESPRVTHRNIPAGRQLPQPWLCMCACIDGVTRPVLVVRVWQPVSSR